MTKKEMENSLIILASKIKDLSTEEFLNLPTYLRSQLMQAIWRIDTVIELKSYEQEQD